MVGFFFWKKYKKAFSGKNYENASINLSISVSSRCLLCYLCTLLFKCTIYMLYVFIAIC